MRLISFKQLTRFDKLAALVIVFSLILRFSGTFSLPSLNWDEISHGYSAYSILKTGKDEWGASWPVIFRAYGDYKLPVYIYLTAISEHFFGLTALSVRLVSILSGVLLVLFSYLLAKKFFGSVVGLATACLVALAPWSQFLSLGAFEANLAQLFVVAGVYFYVIRNRWSLAISMFLLGLSVWAYNSERVFVPLLLGALIVLYRRRTKFSLLVVAVFFIPMFYQLFFADVGGARYKNVAILDQGAIAQIETWRADSELGPQLSRLVFNKATYFGSKFMENYVAHFSPNFLFFKGGDNYQFNIQNHGLLYWVDILPILFGLFYLIKTKNKLESRLLLVWLILAPIPSSLTREAPHTLRAITFLPLPMIISAIGIWQTVGWWQKRVKKPVAINLPIFIYVGIYAYLAAGYITNLFYDYPKNYSQAWQYGYKEVVNYTKSNYRKYDQIIVTKKYGEPHEFFLFYWSWDPQEYRNDPKLERYAQSDWYWVDSFDKFIFVNDWDIPKTADGTWITERKKPIEIDKKTLLITSPGSYPAGWNKLETVDFLNGDTAFEILEN